MQKGSVCAKCEHFEYRTIIILLVDEHLTPVENPERWLEKHFSVINKELHALIVKHS